MKHRRKAPTASSAAPGQGQGEKPIQFLPALRPKPWLFRIFMFILVLWVAFLLGLYLFT